MLFTACKPMSTAKDQSQAAVHSPPNDYAPVHRWALSWRTYYSAMTAPAEALLY